MKIYSPRQEGIQKFLLREYEGAIIDFNKALENNPYDFEVFWKRGVAKSKLNNYKSAEEDFIKSERLRKEFNEMEAQKKAQVEDDNKFLSDEEGQINNVDQIRCNEGGFVFMADRISWIQSKLLEEQIKRSKEEKDLYLKLLKNKNGKDKKALESEYIESRKFISFLAFKKYFYRDFSYSISNIFKNKVHKEPSPLEFFCLRILVSTYYHFFNEKEEQIEIPKVKPDLIQEILNYLSDNEKNWVKRSGLRTRECTNEIINELIINDMDSLLSKDPRAQFLRYMDERSLFVEKNNFQGTKKYNSYGLRIDFVWKKEEFFNAFDYDKFKLILHSALDSAVKKEMFFGINDLELINFN